MVTTFEFGIDKQGLAKGNVTIWYKDGTVTNSDHLSKNSGTQNGGWEPQTLTVQLLKKPIEKIRFSIWRN